MVTEKEVTRQKYTLSLRATWSKPVVIARSYKVQNEDTGKTWLSYPYAFEARPGEIGVTIIHGGLRIKLKESDFTQK